MNKAYLVQLYPNESQKLQIDKTIGCSRFLYNQMLAERIRIYEELKDDKEKLYSYKYKTEKQYKEEFEFLKEASSRALQQSRKDLDSAYKNFFTNLKKGRKAGFPKFKSKHKVKWSYREPQSNDQIIIDDNKLTLLKLGKVKFRGLSKQFEGIIKSVTVTKSRTNKYFASILVERVLDKKQRVSDNIIGIDLGLKELITCSDGAQINGVKTKMNSFDKSIRKQQKHVSRKVKGSNRRKKSILKLNRLQEQRSNYLNNFQWNLVSKLCSENQAVAIEDLNIIGMKKNKKLSHAIHEINWGSLISKLERKSLEYDTTVYRIDRWFPSSKLCSKCGSVKESLSLSERYYICDCGNDIDRDLNAAINIRNYFLNKKSLEYSDNKHGEDVRLRTLIYQNSKQFSEKCLQEVS